MTIRRDPNLSVIQIRTEYVKIKTTENENLHFLKFQLKGAASHREVKQFHYTSWPDHGVPGHPLPVLTYIRKSLEANPGDGGPIIVHCSAGVGRTGTYIAIDSMLQQVLKG